VAGRWEDLDERLTALEVVVAWLVSEAERKTPSTKPQPRKR